MIAHKWQPIQPADAVGEQYDFSEIDSLQRQWLSIKEAYDDSSQKAHKSFLERLGRSWAIETGIIEGLYTLDRGVTETLIKRGIAADFIEREATNRDPQDLVMVLKDQEEAIDFVYQYIRGGHPLSKSFIHQLHQLITRHQGTYSAIDQFGNRFEATLNKGTFKSLPNNPTRQDGSMHEYCPPEQVDSEIDNLLYFYNEMQQAKDVYHPLLTGAWLHHAFTQIHPFQDGNGRVVRALLTWHLVKENFLPIVISRDDRENYIDALETADKGSLTDFIDLIVHLEKRTILQALGEPEPAEQPGLVDQVLDHIVERARQRNQEREDQMRSVNLVARSLSDILGTRLLSRGQNIRQRLSEVGIAVEPLVNYGDPERHQHWYASEIAQTAQNAKHWANANEARYFVRLLLTNLVDSDSDESLHPALRFVVSLHHVGKELSGIMAATAFARIEYPRDFSENSEVAGSRYFMDCTVSPVTFTPDSDTAAIALRLEDMVERGLGIALSYWREFI